jgi:hypothetical protein
MNAREARLPNDGLAVNSGLSENPDPPNRPRSDGLSTTNRSSECSSCLGLTMETIGVPLSPSLRVLARLSGRRPWSCD